jgi:hypothetical protein
MMRFQFKHQKFQTGAAKAICALFRYSGFTDGPSKINVEEISRLLAPNTSVKVL